MSHSDSGQIAIPISTRRISDRSFLGRYVVAFLLGVVVATILFVVGLGLFSPLAGIPLVCVFLQSRLARVSTEYRLFPDRIEVESGILSRRIENIELFRVRDVGLQQGLFGRIGNFGDVHVHSTDASTPDVHVRAIDSPKEFYQEVRRLVTASRGQTRTMIVEDDMPIDRY